MTLTFTQQREFRRVRARMTARMSIPDRAVRVCPVRNVGLGGVYLELDDSLRTGDTCALELSLGALPRSPKVQARGRVVRVERDQGTALQFIRMTLESFDQLDRLVSGENPSDGSPETESASDGSSEGILA